MTRRPFADRTSKDEATTDTDYGTRLRALPMAVVGVLSLAVLHALIGAGVLAINFTTVDHHFKIYSNYAQGVYGAGFLGRNQGSDSGSQVGVAQVGMRSALLSGLCMINTDSIAGNQISVIVSGGVPVKHSFDNAALTTTDGAGNPIHLDAAGLLTDASLDSAVDVTDMYLNATALEGFGNKFSGLNLGQNAEDAAAQAGLGWTSSTHGGTAATPGQFGLEAKHLNIAGLNGSTYGVDLAGGLTLPGLKISVVRGNATQSDCPQ